MSKVVVNSENAKLETAKFISVKIKELADAASKKGK